MSLVIIGVAQDAPIAKTSFVESNTIRPPNFIFKSQYNFTILSCLEEYIKINDTQPTSVNCMMSDHSEKYGPDQIYLGLIVNDANYTPDQKL
uniref:Uncharacterized protein n=1 Tax=Rhizophagus irregularis (strain DAOM 181602 / DAOM 197198 / MUCL 43194) TaxID=747089 RepID=U9UHL4_RHIID